MKRGRPHSAPPPETRTNDFNSPLQNNYINFASGSGDGGNGRGKKKNNFCCRCSTCDIVDRRDDEKILGKVLALEEFVG